MSYYNRSSDLLQLEEHLLAYYRVWQVNLNEYVSKANSEIQRTIVDLQIRNPARSNDVPRHLSPDFLPRDVTAGLLPKMPVIPPLPPSIIMRRQPVQTSGNSATHYQSEQQPTAELNMVVHTGIKRKADELLIVQGQRK